MLNLEDSNEYICHFEGFNVDNIELLAGCIAQIGFSDESNESKNILKKHCNFMNFVI